MKFKKPKRRQTYQDYLRLRKREKKRARQWGAKYKARLTARADQNVISKPSSYQQYIRSKIWRKRKQSYYQRHMKQCSACFTTNHIDLHHIRYNRLGREEDSDLVPFCRDCHTEFHKRHGVSHDMAIATLHFIDQNYKPIISQSLL